MGTRLTLEIRSMMILWLSKGKRKKENQEVGGAEKKKKKKIEK